MESVQRNFIWHLFKRCGKPNMPYNDCLVWLQLPLWRCIRKDLIMCYKIMHGYVVLDLSDLFVLSNNSRTKSHNFKLFKKQFCLDIFKYFFIIRVIDMCNSLPEVCVLSLTFY